MDHMDSFDTLRGLLTKDRSVRRFRQHERISDATLTRLVDLTRLCASGRNLQPLRYRLVSSPEECQHVFPMLAWAGYLTDWDGPAEGERPAAYIIQCLDTSLTPNCLCDDGLHLQTLTLGACAMGIGACIIKSFKADSLHAMLGLDSSLKILYVLALGYPAEDFRIEDTDGTHDADIRYYRTKDGIHHVPKRPTEELIVKVS